MRREVTGGEGGGMDGHIASRADGAGPGGASVAVADLNLPDLVPEIAYVDP